MDNIELFKGVRFFAMGELSDQVKKYLRDGKAKSEEYLSAMVTHAIVSDRKHYELDAAQNMWQIPTVTPSWVEMSVLCQKLLPTKGFLPDSLFQNVVASFSNLPKTDKAMLWALLSFYGGKCHSKFDKNCTHLVTPLPSGEKYNAAVKQSEIKVVAPDWITDSITAKELKPSKQYHPQLNVVPSPVKESSPSPKETLSESLQKLEKLSVDATGTDHSQADLPKISETSSTVLDTKNQTTEDLPSVIKQGAQFQKQTVPGSAAASNQYPSSVKQESSKVSPAAAFPTESSQKPKLPVSTSDGPTMQMARQTTAQFRPAANASNQRFTVPSAAGMRHPNSTPTHPMMSSGGQKFPKTTTGQQVFLPNQATPSSLIAPTDHPHSGLSPASSYVVVSSSQNRSSTSPRRNSTHSSGGKKKKSSSRTAMSGHSNMPQMHPMSQFQNASQAAMFSQQQQQQQQMIQKMRMSGVAGDQLMQPVQNMVDASSSPMMGPRFGSMVGAQGRFSAPGMMTQHDENAQLHQQHMMQQQQLQRMALMRQSQPSNAAVMNQMDRMQPKWPRQPMDSNFSVEHQGHQFYPTHGPHQAATTEDGQAMHQAVQAPMAPVQQGMPLISPNTPSAHQHFNPAMVNRFGTPMNPQQQQQQMIFQQMQQQQQQQQQHQASNRYPTSTSLEAAGMSGISPLALQQGLLNADVQADNPPLIHPSLQGMPAKVPTSSQSSTGSSTPKKRAKSRKKTDAMDEEGKSRQRQRANKAKQKSLVAPTSLSIANTNMNPMQSPPAMMLPPQIHFPNSGQKVSPSRGMGNHPGMPQVHHGPQFNVAPPSIPPQLQSPLAASNPPLMLPVDKPPAVIPQSNIPISQTPIPPVLPEKKELSVTSTELKPVEKMEIDPITPSRDFIDPLYFKISQLEMEYFTRPQGDSVPENLFLLGCVFHIIEYDTILSNASYINLWKVMIEKYGGLVEEQYGGSCTHLICATCTTPVFKQALSDGKRCVTIYWLNDLLLLKTLRVPWLAIHLPTLFSFDKKPGSKHTMTYTNFHAKERNRIKMMGFVCGVKFTGFLSRTHTGLLCKTKNGLKYDNAKSWSISCPNIIWLRDVLQSDGTAEIDMRAERYQKQLDPADVVNGFLLEVSKAQPLLQAWKTPIHLTQECILRARVKHKFDPMPPSPSQPKRLKSELNPEPLPRVCFTGFPLSAVLDMTKKLEALNGKVVDTFALCTHLVAKSISRTVKFLCCISSCSYVVTSNWIEDSFKNNWLLDESKYWLNDKIAEESFKFSLQESVKRANAAPLFRDILFCISSGVAPKKEVKQIIECAGGRVLNKIPALSVLKHIKGRKSPDNNAIIISCPNDEKFYKQLKKEGIPVHNAEIVLTGVLKQEIDYKSYQL